MTTTTTRGGRRHGLTLGGPSQRLLLTITEADADALARLAAEGECSMAEVVRRLIRGAAQRPIPG